MINHRVIAEAVEVHAHTTSPIVNIATKTASIFLLICIVGYSISTSHHWSNAGIVHPLSSSGAWIESVIISGDEARILKIEGNKAAETTKAER